MLRFHTQTAGVQLTAQQPEVNLVRVAVQGLAAVLGGTQSLHTNSYDEAIALPTVKAATLALRTQQVLAYETDVTATVDPFAGSYVVEAMTDEVEAGARALMAAGRGPRRRGRGDRAGLPEERDRDLGLPDRARHRLAASASSSALNRFRAASEERYEPLRVDPSIEADQRARLADAAGPARRRGGERHLAALKEAAAGSGNVLLPMKEALRELATVGEVCGALREVWGVYRPQEFF